MKLRPRILSELKPGTRVVSHSFDLGDWEPDWAEKVDGRIVYLWIVPDCGKAGRGHPMCKTAASRLLNGTCRIAQSFRT